MVYQRDPIDELVVMTVVKDNLWVAPAWIDYWYSCALQRQCVFYCLGSIPVILAISRLSYPIESPCLYYHAVCCPCRTALGASRFYLYYNGKMGETEIDRALLPALKCRHPTNVIEYFEDCE